MEIPSHLIKRCKKFIEPYRVTDGKGFKLSHHDPGDLGKLDKDSKKEAVEKLEKGIELLGQLQEVLYASESYALLVILQAMDSAGKDGIVKHVMGGINPQGCVVSSFKYPSTVERSHDFLWRCVMRLPQRGMIGIFNRSYYEEVLSVRVHPEYLAGEGFDPGQAGKAFWKERYRSINNLERHLHANKTRFVKIFLHLSYEEQRKRLLARLDTPDKNWKFSEGDIHEREYWDGRDDTEYGHSGCSLVCGSGGQQVVFPAGLPVCDCRRPDGYEAEISASVRGVEVFLPQIPGGTGISAGQG